MDINCPKCGGIITDKDAFCSHCGAQLVFNTDLSKAQKTKVYILSFLLAPFGLYWFFKYNKEDDSDKKLVARRVVWITIAAVVVMLLLGIKSASLYKDMLYDYSSIYGY